MALRGKVLNSLETRSIVINIVKVDKNIIHNLFLFDLI